MTKQSLFGAIIIPLASVFIWGTTFASAPVFDWSVTYNVIRSDVGVAVAVDNENYIILVDFADDGQDFLLVKFDGQDGGEIWSHAFSFGGNSLNSLTDVAVDSANNVIVGGESGETRYLAKFSPEGGLLWQLGSLSGSVVYSVAVDFSNNIYYSAIECNVRF
jgi:hypothetical protein